MLNTTNISVHWLDKPFTLQKHQVICLSNGLLLATVAVSWISSLILFFILTAYMSLEYMAVHSTFMEKLHELNAVNPTAPRMLNFDLAITLLGVLGGVVAVSCLDPDMLISVGSAKNFASMRSVVMFVVLSALVSKLTIMLYISSDIRFRRPVMFKSAYTLLTGRVCK
jgi:hypothetical protein